MDSACSNKVAEFAIIFPILKTLMHLWQPLFLVSKDNLTYPMLKKNMYLI